MLSTIRKIIQGLFEIVSHVLKVIWSILRSVWMLLVLVIGFLVGIYPYLDGVIDTVTMHVIAATSVLAGSTEGMKAALEAGWPPQLAGGLAFVNAYFPVAEVSGMTVTLISVYVVATLVRIVKSFFPTIN